MNRDGARILAHCPVLSAHHIAARIGLELACAVVALAALLPGAPAMAAAEAAYRQLDLFGEVYEHITESYVEERSPAFLATAAIEGMIAAAPGNPGIEAARAAADGLSGTETSDPKIASLDAFGDAFEAMNGAKSEDGGAALINAAITNMVRVLDQHSSFISAEQMGELRANTFGEFGGLGVEVAIEGDFVNVVAPLDGTPADRAGLQTGDLIVAIDGTTTREMELASAVGMMRGRIGSPIVLTIRRKRDDGSPFDFDVTIVRDTIRVIPVKYETRGNVGYVRITTFSQLTAQTFAEAIEALKSASGADLKGFVIDLRNNSGGLLDQVAKVADALLDEGEIYSVRSRAEEHAYESAAEAGTIVDGLPIAVLINGGTASGSEILSAAIQDYERGTIIGQPSFGKGSVQNLFTLSGDAALKLTVGYYHRPGGGPIEGYGLAPDILVEPGAGGDTQLEAALALIEDPENFEARRQQLAATGVPQIEPNDEPAPPPAANPPAPGDAGGAPADLGTRVALIIGNSNYEHTPALRNPANDAADMAATLARLGFEVIARHDLTKQGMDDAFREFARQVRGADAALFYYAGHAMQFEGVNYLMPVDARLADEVDVPYEMAKVDDIVADMARMSGVRIAILDSCRDNPLEAALKGNLARSRGIAQSRGLSRIARPEGLIVAYATQAGNIANDGNGRNSPFTGALLQHIETEGLEIGPMFRRVMRSVKEETGGGQHPELSVLFDGEFYFRPGG